MIPAAPRMLVNLRIFGRDTSGINFERKTFAFGSFLYLFNKMKEI